MFVSHLTGLCRKLLNNGHANIFLVVKEASDVNIKATMAVHANEKWHQGGLCAPNSGGRVNIPATSSQVAHLEVLKFKGKSELHSLQE